MRAPSLLIMTFAAMVSLTACTTQLTGKGSKVDLVTASTADHCDLIKIFTVEGSDADEALRIALNDSAQLGADSMAVASGRKTDSGTEIDAAALTCHR